MTRTAAAALLALSVAIGAALAQEKASPAFEVASVKPNVTGPGSSNARDSSGGYVATNFPLRSLIAFAYRLNFFDFDLIVGPSWIDSARFDVNARAPEGTLREQIPDMLRLLLTTRFKLVTHTEARKQSVYALVRARGDGRLGPRLTVSSQDCSKPPAPNVAGATTPAVVPGARAIRCGISVNADGTGRVMRGGGRSMADLVRTLRGQVGRTVIDRTGLDGSYDLELRWTLENTENVIANAGPSGDGTTLVTALQEQLGLKLERTTASVEVLVIDSIERPSPD